MPKGTKVHKVYTKLRHKGYSKAPSGKRVYDYLSKFCFENQSTFDAGSQSTCNFNEGSRFVILEIKKWLEFDLTKGVNYE